MYNEENFLRVDFVKGDWGSWRRTVRKRSNVLEQIVKDRAFEKINKKIEFAILGRQKIEHQFCCSVPPLGIWFRKMNVSFFNFLQNSRDKLHVDLSILFYFEKKSYSPSGRRFNLWKHWLAMIAILRKISARD